MNAPRSAISVLRFGAGDLALAIAAEDVIAVDLVRAGAVHIGEVLGVGGSPRMLGQRMVRVHAPGIHSGAEAAFLADPPVMVIACQPGQILPMAPGIPRDRWQPVMGFARIAEEMVLLLDIPGIIQALAEQEEREVR